MRALFFVVAASVLCVALAEAAPVLAPALRDAPPALVRTLLESTPHLVRDRTMGYPKPNDAPPIPERSYCGWYEFDDRRTVGGFVCGAGDGVLANGQRVVVIMLDTGGNDMRACYGLLYTSIAGRFRFVGYIPARWCRFDIDIDSTGHLRSYELANGTVPLGETMADNNARVIVTTYDLTGTRLRTLTRRAATFPGHIGR